MISVLVKVKSKQKGAMNLKRNACTSPKQQLMFARPYTLLVMRIDAKRNNIESTTATIQTCTYVLSM